MVCVRERKRGGERARARENERARERDRGRAQDPHTARLPQRQLTAYHPRPITLVNVQSGLRRSWSRCCCSRSSTASSSPTAPAAAASPAASSTPRPSKRCPNTREGYPTHPHLAICTPRFQRVLLGHALTRLVVRRS
eukprot:953035-Rhodomonas_salina.1